MSVSPLFPSFSHHSQNPVVSALDTKDPARHDDSVAFQWNADDGNLQGKP